jgi:hypothetical protein
MIIHGQRCANKEKDEMTDYENMKNINGLEEQKGAKKAR